MAETASESRTTTTPPSLAFKPRLAWQLWWLLGIGIGFALLGLGLAPALAAGALVAALWSLMCALTVGLAYRLVRLSVVARGDRLTVHNLFSSETLGRESIVEFWAGAGGSFFFSFAKTLHVRLRNGDDLALDVFTCLWWPSLMPNSRRRLAQQADELQRWLANA